jgi:hypothetical protein
MMKLSTSSPSSPTEGTTIGESLLDVICVNHSSKPGNITLYEDRLHTNIIRELSLKYYLKDNQGKKPVVRRAYTEGNWQSIIQVIMYHNKGWWATCTNYGAHNSRFSYATISRYGL